MISFAAFSQWILTEAALKLDEYAFVRALPETDASQVILAGEIAIYDGGTKLALLRTTLAPLLQGARDSLAKADCNLNAATKIILMCCTDHSRSYQARKALLERGEISLSKELAFVRLLMSRTCSAPILWNYRRHLVERLSRTETTTDLVSEELKLCSWAASRFTRNYYCWRYRYWIVREFRSVNLLLEEVETSRKWIGTQLSDRSAWHHYEMVLYALVTGSFYNEFVLKIGRVNILEDCFEWARKLRADFPDVSPTCFNYHFTILDKIRQAKF